MARQRVRRSLSRLSLGAAAHGDHEVGDYVVVFGWRNEPAHVVHTARTVAESIGMDGEDFAAQTTANFDRLFSKAAA